MTFNEWFDSTTYHDKHRSQCRAAWEASSVHRQKQLIDLALTNSKLVEELDEMKAVLRYWRDEVDTPESAQLFEIMVKGVLGNENHV